MKSLLIATAAALLTLTACDDSAELEGNTSTNTPIEQSDEQLEAYMGNGGQSLGDQISIAQTKCLKENGVTDFNNVSETLNDKCNTQARAEFGLTEKDDVLAN